MIGVPIVLNFLNLGAVGAAPDHRPAGGRAVRGGEPSASRSSTATARAGPTRKWRWITPGSLAAAVSGSIGSAAFSYYLANFGDYSATYGSLGAAIGAMMWIYISMWIILVGAELNSEIEHQTAKDTTTGPEKPLGSRGATMADRVGPARA